MRENPRPEPLPTSVAAAGVLAVERIAQLQTELNAVKQHNAAIKSLSDPKAVERLARERLGYARSNEVVVRFEAPLTNPATRR